MYSSPVKTIASQHWRDAKWSDILQEWLDIPILVLVLSGRSQRNRTHGVKGKQGVAKPVDCV